MFITIAVIAYNEENTIKNILDDISRQDYDHNLMEVVLVDSASLMERRRLCRSLLMRIRWEQDR